LKYPSETVLGRGTGVLEPFGNQHLIFGLHRYEEHRPGQAIERIREACGLVGYDFEYKLPDLEIYLEGLVFDGENDEVRLTIAGLTFLSKSSSENPTT
jgi:hypothetical protein